jgi:hypothetical protein
MPDIVVVGVNQVQSVLEGHGITSCRSHLVADNHRCHHGHAPESSGQHAHQPESEDQTRNESDEEYTMWPPTVSR